MREHLVFPARCNTAASVGQLLMVVLLSALAAGCALSQRDLEAPEVTLRALTPIGLDSTAQVFLCRFLLENPNDEDLDIRGGQVTLRLADFSAARGETTEAFVLPAYGSREVDVKVELDLLGSLPGLLRWIGSGDPDLDYRLQGYVDLDRRFVGRLPFRTSGQITADRLFRQLPGILRQQPPPSPVAVTGAPDR